MAESSAPTSPVIAYEPTAVLEIEHVAAWLRVSVRMVERLDIPCIMLGDRTRRYLASDIVEYLRKKSRAA